MRTRSPFALAVLALALPLSADEGMWMPQQIPDLAPRLKALGFTPDPKGFADLTGQPMGAIVSLGGCSASFVSPDGLIVTNHHCVVGSLQFNSTKDRDLIQDGYLAKTRDQELSNGPGSRVFVTTSVKEVTNEITGGLDPKLTDRQRFDAIDKREKERTAACEKDGSRCRIAAYFEGAKYFEIAQMEIKDVRIVYAPPAGIGVFGGETDNWQWPRHTGDWSFYRAYVSKDGKSVPYSKDNVPYQPKHWLKVSPEGANPGDLVFVVGYPGRTSRHQTYEELKDQVEFSMPRFVKSAKDRIAIIEEVSKGNKETEIKTTSMKRGLNNSLTNREGVLEGMRKGNLLAKKEALQKELLAWIAADAARQKEYGPVFAELGKMRDEMLKTRERDTSFRELLGGSQLLGAAQTMYRFSIEKTKKDLDREAQFQERNWNRIKEFATRMEKSLDARADRALLRYTLLGIARLPAEQRIPALDKESGLTAGMSEADAAKTIDAFLDKLYAGTKLTDTPTRLAMLDKSTAELLATKDSFLSLAAALDPLSEELRERGKNREGAAARLKPTYMKAILAKNGGLVAPDANSTLRVTFGTVKGVESKDGMFYLPQTTLKGIVAKHTGTGDFNAPKKELDAIAALRAGKKTPYFDVKLNDVPVNFLSSVDTTGGNSGSATLNAKGELCGLLFDGTYDTVASDYLYDTVKTRSIHVDSRYMLWAMSEVDGADNLLKEIQPAKSLSVTPIGSN